MTDVTRREWIQGALATGVCLTTYSLSTALAQTGAPAGGAGTAGATRAGEFNWVEPPAPGTAGVMGTTWGVPWAKGALKAGAAVRLIDGDGKAAAAQTWPLAYWPDGSVKWLAAAAAPASIKDGGFKIEPGEAAAGDVRLNVKTAGDTIEIDTGVMRCVIGKTGERLIHSITRGDKETLSNGRLVAMRQDAPGDAEAARRESFVSRIEEAFVEQDGPVRGVVRISGKHAQVAATGATGTGAAGEPRAWLPFTVRLYFYAGSDVVRLMHSFIYDADEHKDFLCGLGVRFDVPLRDQPHDRHVRLVGDEHGLFAEAVRIVTGQRRDPGSAVKSAQVAGRATPPVSEWPAAVRNGLHLIPAWGDVTLSQLSADGFQIRKRTKPGHAWIPAGTGKRAAGVGFIGGPGGGVSFGMRDFWQKHPVQLDVRDAHTERAQVTIWMWSPEAQPMDTRMYHDGMGMDTYAKQIDGLNITYEDFEFGYGTPYGIARTTELYLRAEPATPTREAMVIFADAVRKPPQLSATPQRFLETGVFGRQWTLPDTSGKAKAWIEANLSGQLDLYVKEVDQRSWYGFWDFGDVMHSYDEDRHVWRYDNGGMAWDNSELSPDLWLWMSYLRTGRGDVFRMAEAMTRHTGEVDVYHLGRFKGLGTRHGVQHWSDSSKQTRISTPVYRRIYYYLTGDERVGDLMREQLQALEAEKKINVTRKLGENRPVLPLPPVEMPPPGGDVNLGGLNYGNAMAAWITEAERTNDPAWHNRIVTSMKGIGELPLGFFTTGWTVNIETGQVKHNGSREVGLSHLMSCFGLPEIVHELVDLYGEQAPKFADAWAQYGRLYNGTNEDRQKELNLTFRAGNLRESHSRCTAFAARHGKNAALAARAWDELLGNRLTREPTIRVRRLEGPVGLNAIDEAALNTNSAAQWGLAAMECLALIGDSAP
ncbi:MAG TPA: hypothetical protein VF624_10515 [Tepidisphaeraceae bacterium]